LGEQLLLPTHRRGGRRRGAGRPKKADSGVSHLRRPGLSHNHPVHLTLRVVDEVGNLRKGPVRRAIFRAFAGGCNRFGFRLVHFSVQQNHMHFICEADDERALTKGMQGLSIRVAKAINRRLGRRGTVFSDRYHARALKTPREVRNGIAYVINNARRHSHRPPGWMDPCSTASFFKGWQPGVAIRADDSLAELCSGASPPFAKPQSWLLTRGWHRHGLLSPNEVPGPKRRRG
jgi:REP element-mobilizing transposase RayT